MLNKITWKIIVTYSKLHASLILILGFIISLKLKEVTVITIAIITSAALVSNKQYQDRIKAIKGNIADNNNNNKQDGKPE